MGKKYKVAVVDDHNLLATAIGELINSFDDFECMYTCKNGADFLKRIVAPEYRPDLVLMDVNMPVLNGKETTAILTEKYPDILVIALSMEDSEQTIIEMLRAGAKGYLLKESKKDVLEKALKECLEIGFYYTNTVSSILMKSIEKPTNEKPFDLTEKELAFIELACSDLTYKEIAAEMFLSPKTIDNYRDSVFQKLAVKNRIGLVLFAVKNNLFTI